MQELWMDIVLTPQGQLNDCTSYVQIVGAYIISDSEPQSVNFPGLYQGFLRNEIISTHNIR